MWWSLLEPPLLRASKFGTRRGHPRRVVECDWGTIAPGLHDNRVAPTLLSVVTTPLGFFAVTSSICSLLRAIRFGLCRRPFAAPVRMGLLKSGRTHRGPSVGGDAVVGTFDESVGTTVVVSFQATGRRESCRIGWTGFARAVARCGVREEHPLGRSVSVLDAMVTPCNGGSLTSFHSLQRHFRPLGCGCLVCPSAVSIRGTTRRR